MAFANGGSIVTSGLVLALDASDRNSYVSGSTTWRDLSGNSNNGTLTNGPTFNTEGSFSFDGTNNYIIVPSSSVFDVSTTSSLSLEAWIYPTATANGGYIITEEHSGATLPVNFSLQITNGSSVVGTGQYPTFGRYNGSSWTNIYSTTTIPLNIWTHLVGIFNGSAAFLYANGVQLTVNGSITTWINAVSSNLNIGRRWDPVSPAFFQGKMSSIKIYNKALSAQEVLQNYNAQKSRFGL
jgi:hypothetical protein